MEFHILWRLFHQCDGSWRERKSCPLKKTLKSNTPCHNRLGISNKRPRTLTGGHLDISKIPFNQSWGTTIGKQSDYYRICPNIGTWYLFIKTTCPLTPPIKVLLLPTRTSKTTSVYKAYISPIPFLQVLAYVYTFNNTLYLFIVLIGRIW